MFGIYLNHLYKSSDFWEKSSGLNELS